MKIVVDENIEEKRLDVFITDLLDNVSRSKIQADIKAGLVLVNSAKAKPSYIIKENDLIEYDSISSEKILKPVAEDLKLEIIWEDENMAVVNKPSNMLTHPTAQEMSGTLVNALLFLFGENLSDCNGDMRRGIVHRLDRNTSGLLMIAKNNKTHEFLVSEMKEKRFEKKYLAIIKGVVEKDEFAINSPIGRHPTQPHKQAVREDGKESLTLVKVLERFTDATLVELTLITGRTHQIRVHLASIGHPVFNDTLYGFGKMKINTEEQVLQSYKLEFTKPFSNERISLEIEPDEKIKRVLKFINS